MVYSIKDILERLIIMEKEMSKLYFDISNTEKVDIQSLKILSKVMGREEGRHAILLKEIKEGLEDNHDIEIDFFTYDRISQLMYEFKGKTFTPEIKNMKDLMKFILNFEKENLALLIDIQGRLIRSNIDVKKKSYSILSELIKEEKKHIEALKPYYKEKMA